MSHPPEYNTLTPHDAYRLCGFVLGAIPECPQSHDAVLAVHNAEWGEFWPMVGGRVCEDEHIILDDD